MTRPTAPAPTVMLIRNIWLYRLARRLGWAWLQRQAMESAALLLTLIESQ